MRYLRYAFLAVLAICLLVMALANRNTVTLTLLPEEIAAFAGFNASVSLPLFLVIFGGIVAGVVIGFVWEWLREHKHRAEAVTQRREREKLEREVHRLKPASERQSDDVLALLETGGRAR
jgi:lipopolysaccharide assembly protein A